VELVDARNGSAASAGTAAPPLSRSGAVRFYLRHPRFAVRPGLVSCTRAARLAVRVVRRAFDVLVASLLLMLFAPLLAVIALAIRVESGGPSLFRQRRLGRHAQAFQIYKFRTMRANVDATPHEEYVRRMITNGEAADVDGARIFKVYPDPRVTRVGHLLRRWSLDELPQLWNVLRGEMTLVGFRPPITYELRYYPAWYHRRFDGKPGLTGLWQVSGRNERSYQEMVSMDIEYLTRRSWLLDLKLLVKTVGVVLARRGAY
jgi:lipopolysaccharide/colanic/teichoic acid biosynthesis glycosyltransferase